ncbi:MAG: hypothetical protein EXS10_09810 [Phycisphaerales bacterium]|nr:hypothetical protein [Phycisphaerales bacterium]
MKTKGMKPIEQHVEKIVLGVSLLALVGVAGWQFVVSPNDVQLGSETLNPSAIDAQLRSKIDSVNAQLQLTKPSISLPLDNLTPAADTFIARLDRSVSPSPRLARLEPAMGSLLSSGGGSTESWYHEPELAAVALQPTMQLADTLDETVVVAHPELKSLLASPSAPYDVLWTVPSAVLDLAAVRKEMSADDLGLSPARKQIPTIWYNSAFYIVDVQFRRQTERADGTWGDEVLVEHLPTVAFNYRAEIAKGADAGLRQSVFTQLSDPANQRDVIQPAFLPTKTSAFSNGLMLADSGVATDTDKPEVRAAKKKLAAAQENLAQTTQQLTEAGGPLEEAPKKPGNDGTGGRPGGGLGGGGGGAGGGGGMGGGGLSGGMGGGKRGGADGKDPRDEATKAKRIALTRRMKKEQQQVETYDASLKALDAQATLVAPKSKFPDLAADPSVLVWTHDISVVPGKTYRYACSANFYNPFFARGAQLVADQKAKADPFTMASIDSGWGAPIRVIPPVAFFFVDAAPAEGRLGVGQASAEIYRYRDGARRRERVTLQPGDIISSSGDPMDFRTGYYIVDIVADPTVDRGTSDRRGAAVVLVKELSRPEDPYEVRVPSDDARDARRNEYFDDAELAELTARKKSDPKANPADAATPGDPPAGGTGGGAGAGAGGDAPKYGPRGGD